MKKIIFILVICMAMILVAGCQKKEAPVETEESAMMPAEEPEEVTEMEEAEETAVEMSLIEKVAKIAAAFEVDPAKGDALLQEAGMAKEDYEKVLADIALDEESQELFEQKKAEFKAEMQQ